MTTAPWVPPGPPGATGRVRIGRPLLAVAVVGGVGVAADVLLWGHPLGLGWALLVGGAVTATAAVARAEQVPLASTAAVPAAAALALALGVVVRAEPLTTAANLFIGVAALGVAAHAAARPSWVTYGPRQWAVAAGRLTADGLVGPPLLGAAAARRAAADHAELPRRAVPLLRGLGIALPLVAVFGVLLASADAVFAARLGDLATALRLPSPAEAVLRLTLVGATAWVVAASLWHLRSPGVPDRPATPGRRPLGLTEAVTVLGSVDLLFAAFVVVQVRYFFGGRTTILDGGLTYAEYARRGFAELVIVAVGSLALVVVLGALTRRAATRDRWLYRGLTATLVTCVLVILASAFQRLVLYEQAFGFTRTRTAVHVFMVWLGVLLLVALLLELVDRQRWSALAALAATLGFALTLNALGVDGLVARHNVARAEQGAALDTEYLAGLSADATLVLADLWAEVPPPARHRAGRGARLPPDASRRARDRLGGLPRRPPASRPRARRARAVPGRLHADDDRAGRGRGAARRPALALPPCVPAEPGVAAARRVRAPGLVRRS